MARNNVVIPDCEGYEGGNCTSDYRTNDCLKNLNICCCVCNEHLACFISVVFGCIDADKAVQMANFFGEMTEAMWINQNEDSHCPIDGHL